MTAYYVIWAGPRWQQVVAPTLAAAGTSLAAAFAQVIGFAAVYVTHTFTQVPLTYTSDPSFMTLQPGFISAFQRFRMDSLGVFVPACSFRMIRKARIALHGKRRGRL